MNGDSAPDTHTNGAYNTDTVHADEQILRALELIYDPRSSNAHRQDASQYLEQIKAQPDAPFHGYLLASNKSQLSVVRHYGLSLLENAVRYRWTDYTVEQSSMLRDWVWKLAQSIVKEDALFIRNKIAQLWVEIAKRSWLLDWMDMDELLVNLWNGSISQKELVLEVLETLSENSFGKEDSTVALRGGDVTKACVEIFTPADVLAKEFPKRDASINVRFGQEGWLARIADLLAWCNSSQDNEDLQSCAIKAVLLLKSVVHWAILSALATTKCVQRVCESMTMSNQALQLAAVETLYNLYSRSNLSDENVQDLVWPMYGHNTTNVLRTLYEQSLVDANNIDDHKYLLCKKFSEMIYNVGKFLDVEQKMSYTDGDLPNFLDLLMSILRNESLHVSIPILHLWAQLLNSTVVGNTDPVLDLIGPLLELCSQRLIRYESLPEDSGLPAVAFLREDLDTVPERHAFLGNYARFCKDTIDSIVQKRPFDALNYILGQADQILQLLYKEQSAFEVHTYNKHSISALKLDAQCSVIEAALIGYGRWRGTEKAKHPDQPFDDQQDVINSNLEAWCTQILDLQFEDPAIQQRLVHLVGEFVTGPLKRNRSFAIRAFSFLMDVKARMKAAPELPQHTLMYNESIKECQQNCSHQMQRFAMRGTDHLITVYDELERRISQYLLRGNIDEQDRDRCVSVLFIVTQRATGMDEVERTKRLETFIQPVMAKWQDPKLSNLLQTFTGFCDLLGLQNLQQYLTSRNVHQVEDWSTFLLDEEGKALKAQIDAAQDAIPFRSTKTFLGVSTERTEYGSPAHQTACALWSKYLPVILPNLLQFISLAHSFAEPASWPNLPVELRGIPARLLKDRFWQVGISSGSREDFYARVQGSKSTLEGLASAIRGSMRLIRETSYRLLFTMSLLDDSLYTYEGLPEPLSKALFASADTLSIHQMTVVLDGIRPVIENCPPAARSRFLPSMLMGMFAQLDSKVSAEWERIEERNRAASPDDDLVEEMKDESILRQLTYNSVSFVVHLLDPNPHPLDSSRYRGGKDHPQSDARSPGPFLRDFVLETPDVLKSVILFCTHALRMHDNRACGLITRVLRSVIPEFTTTTPVAADVREFISTEVFKACIMSLHDQYFVEIQSDLAQLIASITLSYSPQTETPRQVLLSLPDMSPDRVEGAINRLYKSATNSRQQRAVILKLLEGLRGISVSEQGRFARPDPKKVRSAMQEQYMSIDPAHPAKETSPDLGGVSDMFS